ncbi:hypoxanthine phosphoribosyltransferase [Ligilactobacillus saerimneri]|uniref:hypoxanthine phosphoribosyltransferase n=1 Tax=Ligilactobacillus saerimneri TaxID=228229 RepID=UPI0030CA5D98
MNNDIDKILYSSADIQAEVKRLGQQLAADYHGKNPLVICILKGAILFMADIVRNMDIPLEMDFMDISSYGAGTISTGEVRILKDLDSSVKDRDVLIVEDIVDTGRTLKALSDLLKQREANSIKICTLLDKPERRVEGVDVDYVGFQIPDEFVVGYGMDYAGHYRNLPYVGILKREVYENN